MGGDIGKFFHLAHPEDVKWNSPYNEIHQDCDDMIHCK